MTDCYNCGKKNITKNEMGICKKLLGPNTNKFYCISCLASQLEVTDEELLDKIEDFKNEGCKLFE